MVSVGEATSEILAHSPAPTLILADALRRDKLGGIAAATQDIEESSDCICNTLEIAYDSNGNMINARVRCQTLEQGPLRQTWGCPLLTCCP